MGRLQLHLILTLLAVACGETFRSQKAESDQRWKSERVSDDDVSKDRPWKPRQGSDYDNEARGKLDQGWKLGGGSDDDDKGRRKPRRQQAVFTKIDRSDWVDPGDMFNYDHSTQQMRKREEVEDDEACPPCSCSEQTCDCSSVQDELTVCNAHWSGHEESYLECRRKLAKKPPSETAYLQQLVAVIYRHITNIDDVSYIEESAMRHYEAWLRLSGHDLSQLQQYAEDGGDIVQGVHHILVKMIQGMKGSAEHKAPTWNDKLQEMWMNHGFTFLSDEIVEVSIIMESEIACCCLCSFSLVQLILAQWRNPIPFFKLLLVFVTLMFIVSFGWNWWMLYMKEYAARMHKMSSSAPPGCDDKELSVWTAIKRRVTMGPDACGEHFRSLYVNPAFEVAPTKVLAYTITQFCLEPLEHIGTSFGKMLKGLTNELPWYLWAVAIPSLLVLIMFGLLVVNGNRFNFFHLISIEPGQHNVERNMLKTRVEELQIENRELRGVADRRASLPAGIGQLSQSGLTEVPLMQRALSYPATSLVYPVHDEPSGLRYRGQQREPGVQDLTVDSQGGGDQTLDPNISASRSSTVEHAGHQPSHKVLEEEEELQPSGQLNKDSPKVARKEPVYIDLTSPQSKSGKEDSMSAVNASPGGLVMIESLAAAADFPSPQSSSTSSKDITPCSESSEETMLLALRDQEMTTSTGSYVQIFAEKASTPESAGESDSDIEVIEHDKHQTDYSLE